MSFSAVPPSAHAGVGAGPVRHACVAHRSARARLVDRDRRRRHASPRITGKCELGQGMLTAQTQLVAEELSRADRSRDADPVRHRRLRPIRARRPAASRRRRTSTSAISRWRRHGARGAACSWRRSDSASPADQLALADGVIAREADRVEARHLRRARRRQEVQRRRSNSGAKRETARRVDRARHSRSSARRHGRRWRPASSSTCTTCACRACCTARSCGRRRSARRSQRRRSSVRGMPGVVKVVVKKNFVGVVAEKPWQAMQAASALKAQLDARPRAAARRHEFYDHLRTQPSRDAFVVNSRDVDETARAGGDGRSRPPICIRIRCTDRSGRRAPSPTCRRQGDGLVADAVGVSDAQRRGDAARPAGRQRARRSSRAARAATASTAPTPCRTTRRCCRRRSGKPVRVQLSRKDEMAWENYGFAYVIDQRAALDADGDDRRVGLRGVVRRRSAAGPATTRPGNVVTGMLAGFEPAPFTPRTAPEPAGDFQQRQQRRAVVRRRTRRRARPAAPAPIAERARADAHDRVAVLHRTAAVAVAAAEHVRARMLHGRDRRAREGRSGRLPPAAPARPAAERGRVEAAAKAANWDARPSPKPTLARTGVATGRGIACVLYEGDNGYVAMVAEVDVDQATGRGHREAARRRAGLRPDLQSRRHAQPDRRRRAAGLSRALGEEVTWDDQKVTSVDWRTYHSLPLGFDVPVIESVLINRTDVEAMGAGETAITIVAAAVGNAIFDATGARIREVPFTPERVKEHLRSARL